ncbi:MAG TPA: prolipoprotein diacylglyceryl transferase family protein [Anaerolineae bacterium]
MHPTLDLNWFEIPVYTALIGLGAAAGLLAAYLFLRARSRRASAAEVFLDGALIAFAAGWVGARAYHVATHCEYYAARPEEIAQPGLGGLGIRGALVLGLIALLFYSAVRRISFWYFADAAAIGLALGQAIGWVGALIQGANYGVVSDSQIAIDLPDLYGLVQPRFPLQHGEIALFGLLFIGLLIAAAQRPRASALFIAYLLIASLANFALGFQRGDDSAFVGALRVDQVVDAALALLAVLLWLGLRMRQSAVVANDLGIKN